MTVSAGPASAVGAGAAAGVTALDAGAAAVCVSAPNAEVCWMARAARLGSVAAPGSGQESSRPKSTAAAASVAQRRPGMAGIAVMTGVAGKRYRIERAGVEARTSTGPSAAVATCALHSASFDRLRLCFHNSPHCALHLHDVQRPLIGPCTCVCNIAHRGQHSTMNSQAATHAREPDGRSAASAVSSSAGHMYIDAPFKQEAGEEGWDAALGA